MNKRPLRLGMIGAGRTAAWHLRAYARIPGVNVAAIANPKSDRGVRLARRHGIRQRLSSGQELIARAELDAVDICVPSALHRDLVLQALQRGLHVYCEKPLCTSAAQTQAVVAANREAGRIIFNGFNYRFLPPFRKLLDTVRSGRLGEIRYARFQRFTRESPDSYVFSQGGNLFTELHGHFVDLLFAMGFPDPDSVEATGTRVRDWPLSPDTATLTLGFPGGALADVTCSWASPGLAPQAVLVGTQGTVKLQNGCVGVVADRDRWSAAALFGLLLRDTLRPPWRLMHNPFSGSCRHFIARVHDSARSDCDEHAALRVARVTDAATAARTDWV